MKRYHYGKYNRYFLGGLTLPVSVVSVWWTGGNKYGLVRTTRPQRLHQTRSAVNVLTLHSVRGCLSAVAKCFHNAVLFAKFVCYVSVGSVVILPADAIDQIAELHATVEGQTQ